MGSTELQPEAKIDLGYPGLDFLLYFFTYTVRFRIDYGRLVITAAAFPVGLLEWIDRDLCHCPGSRVGSMDRADTIRFGAGNSVPFYADPASDHYRPVPFLQKPHDPWCFYCVCRVGVLGSFSIGDYPILDIYHGCIRVYQAG